MSKIQREILKFYNILASKAGFTLLEMIVVIGIIGILVGMGALSYSTAQRKARDAKRKLDLNAIKNAMEQYYSLCNATYPPAVSGKVPGSIETVVPQCTSTTTIMPATPTDPKTLASYDYDPGTNPPSICAKDGGTNLMETENNFCVYLEQ